MQIANRHADGFVKFRDRHVNQKGDTIQADLSARRVVNAGGGEEVQISVMITTCYLSSSKHYTSCSTLELSSAEVNALIKALTLPWNESPSTKQEN